MHQNIKRFGMKGSIDDDSSFPRLRAQYESLIVQQMRGEGYIPILGFGPFFSTKYLEKGNLYEFKISMYAIKIGEDKAWKIEGIDLDGNQHTRHTHQPKSNQ